jgi:hypothetical protein
VPDPTAPDPTQPPPLPTTVADMVALHSRKTTLLAAMLGLSLVSGMIGAVWFPDSDSNQIAQRNALLFDLAGNIVLFVVGFAWLRLDGLEYRYRRSTNFNVGIVFLAIVFVPVYFYRSRPEGRRLTPILSALGVLIGSVLLGLLGALLANTFVTT